MASSKICVYSSVLSIQKTQFFKKRMNAYFINFAHLKCCICLRACYPPLPWRKICSHLKNTTINTLLTSKFQALVLELLFSFVKCEFPFSLSMMILHNGLLIQKKALKDLQMIRILNSVIWYLVKKNLSDI